MNMDSDQSTLFELSARLATVLFMRLHHETVGELPQKITQHSANLT